MTGVTTSLSDRIARRDPDPYRHLEGALVRLAATDVDDPARRVLRNELAVAFAPVSRTVARRFARYGEPTEDLNQVATIGLLKALDHFRAPDGFDPIRAFVGYAMPTITGEIRRHLRDHTWVVHVPRPVKEAQGRVWRAVAELTRTLGRPPRPREVAAHLALAPALVEEAMTAASARRPTSTDVTDGVAGARVAEALCQLDGALAAAENRTELREALRLLPARSLRILALHFFADRTQAEIARELGISQMQVSRLLDRSMATLRDSMAA